MGIPKPITFTAAGDGYDGPAPENFVIVGDVPAGEAAPVAWGDVTGKPTTFAPATHNQAASTVTVAASSGIVGANAQAVLADLAARVVALETAP